MCAAPSEHINRSMRGSRTYFRADRAIRRSNWASRHTHQSVEINGRMFSATGLIYLGIFRQTEGISCFISPAPAQLRRGRAYQCSDLLMMSVLCVWGGYAGSPLNRLDPDRRHRIMNDRRVWRTLIDCELRMCCDIDGRMF